MFDAAVIFRFRSVFRSVPSVPFGAALWTALWTALRLFGRYRPAARAGHLAPHRGRPRRARGPWVWQEGVRDAPEATGGGARWGVGAAGPRRMAQCVPSFSTISR